MRWTLATPLMLYALSTLRGCSTYPLTNYNGTAFLNLNINQGSIPQLISQKHDLSALTNPSIAGNGFPDHGRQRAVAETESLVSKGDTLYGRTQELVANIFKPKPLVDTIAEHEKYGNDASKGKAISTAFIGGVEGVSNLLNTIVDFPFVAIGKVSKKATAYLNVVGGKLVGLEY